MHKRNCLADTDVQHAMCARHKKKIAGMRHAELLLQCDTSCKQCGLVTSPDCCAACISALYCTALQYVSMVS